MADQRRNNPLQDALSHAELLAQAPHGEPESEELRAIRENASRAASIIRHVLKAAGRDISAPRWQHVNPIVLAAVASRARFLQRSGIEIRPQLAERLPLTYLDATPFERVIASLIQNAEASIAGRRPASGVSLEPGLITIQSRREANADRIVIEIADNGVGVRTEDLAGLFDQAPPAEAPAAGAPFDLSACHLIVRVQGGRLHAHNRDTGGAAFLIELPVTGDSYAIDESVAEDEPIG